jgi:hypothetical protein
MQRYDGVSFSKLSGSKTVTPLRGIPDDDNNGVENNKKASRLYQVVFVDDDDGSVECLGVRKGLPVMQRYDGVSLSQLSGSTTVAQLRTISNDVKNDSRNDYAHPGAKHRAEGTAYGEQKGHAKYVSSSHAQASSVSLQPGRGTSSLMNAVNLPQFVPFRGKSSKGNPVPQSGQWELQNFVISQASVLGKVTNEAKNSVVIQLMMPGSDWEDSDMIYSARCSDKWCKKQFQIRQFQGMLALYTFKEHGVSTEGTTVSTFGHDVDTRSSISRPMGKGATLPPHSMMSRVFNVQASVSRDVHGINADVAYVNKLTVKEMEEEPKFNAQHHSGTKSILRECMIDGLTHGPLVTRCLICRKG